MTLFLALLVPLLARAEAPDCPHRLAPTSPVQLIWYPSSEYFLISHTELVVGETTWKGNVRYRPARATAQTERAARAGGRGFVRISFAATDADVARLREFLETHTLSYGTCSGGPCRAIAKNDVMWTPPYLNQFPTLVVAYLTVAKILGSERVQRIEWVGPRRPRQFLKLSTLGFVAPATELLLAHHVTTDVYHAAASAVRALLGAVGF